MKLPSLLIAGLLWFVVVIPGVAALPGGGVSREQPDGLSFRYERPAEGAATSRQFVEKVPPVESVVYVYAAVHMGPANPINYVGGLPEWRP